MTYYAEFMAMSLGESIKRHRKAASMKQEDLAELMGITQTAISTWETNRSVPDALQLINLARALKVPIQEIVYGINSGYDKLWRDLIRHGTDVDSGPSQATSGGSPDASLAQQRPTGDELRVAARLVELSQECESRSHKLAEYARELEELSHALARRQAAIVSGASAPRAVHRGKTRRSSAV